MRMKYNMYVLQLQFMNYVYVWNLEALNVLSKN